MILHICVPEKFTRQFIELTAEHFAAQTHKFLFQTTRDRLCETDPATFAAITSDSFPFEVFFYEGEKNRYNKTGNGMQEDGKKDTIIVSRCR